MGSSENSQKQLVNQGNSVAREPRQTQSPSSVSVEPEISVPKKSQLLRRCAEVGAMLVLLGSAGAVVWGSWLGVLMIVNPDGALWLNRYLPKLFQIPVTVQDNPQNLAAIEAELSRYGLRLGKALPLGSEMLMPVWWTKLNCESNCDRIVALRIYQYQYHQQQQEIIYQLLREIDVPQMKKSFALEPFLGKQAADQDLPLRQITILEDGPQPGIWLLLKDRVVQSGSRIDYGHLFLYEPSQQNLTPMLPWSSAAAQTPYWQQVTSDQQPELVVKRTSGFEPRFQVYQLQRQEHETQILDPYPVNPFQLQAIALQEPALQVAAVQTDYTEALNLTSQGLWNHAQKKISAIKEQVNPQEWTTTAQAQLDVIAFHAQTTESKCHQSWANPSEQILHCLSNGSFNEALLLLQGSLNQPTLTQMKKQLQADGERFWQRISASGEVSPDDEDIQTWGALLLNLYKNRQAAINWLEQLPYQSTQTRQRIEQLLERVNTILTSPASNRGQPTKIVGIAQPLWQENLAAWLASTEENSLPSLKPTQIWYRIQVTAVGRGEGWQQAPFEQGDFSSQVSGQQLWQNLGLEQNPQLQITTWKTQGDPRSINTNIQAVQSRDGVLELLAAGEALPGVATTQPQKEQLPLLAQNDVALKWLQPGSISLADLYQIQPELVSVIIPELWQELRASGQLRRKDLPSLKEVLAEIGHWSVQPIDLTDNHKPEVILTLDANSLRQLNQPNWLSAATNWHRKYRTGTIIFSELGAIIYSEFSGNATSSLKAIADLGDGGSAALVISDTDNYQLQRWSVEKQSFQDTGVITHR